MYVIRMLRTCDAFSSCLHLFVYSIFASILGCECSGLVGADFLLSCPINSLDHISYVLDCGIPMRSGRRISPSFLDSAAIREVPVVLCIETGRHLAKSPE